LARKAEFEKLDCVSRVVEVASLVPRDQDRKLEQLRDIQVRLKELPPRGVRFKHIFTTDPPALLAEIDELLPALALRPSTVPLLDDLRSSLTTLRDKLKSLTDTEAAGRLSGFDRRLVLSL